MREVISRYSEEYNIPEKVIYTVIYVRSGGDRSFSSRERIGYFALSHEELNTVEELLGINITAEMAGKPSYNLLFGITYLNYLYSSVGDWNAVYAALLCGRDELLEWGSDRRLTDSTGSLIALPEGHAQTDMFRYYIDVEKKYAELYFSDKTKK
jgi:hypothetical protein